MILTKTIARYGRVDLLCIDELGYMALDRRGAELLFQVLTEREEKNSVAIASNESFSGWTKTFTDPRLCAAIVDRLHLRRPHHRDRHRLLPPGPHPRPTKPVNPSSSTWPNCVPGMGDRDPVWRTFCDQPDLVSTVTPRTSHGAQLCCT